MFVAVELMIIDHTHVMV